LLNLEGAGVRMLALDGLEYKPAQKRALVYTYMNVDNDFTKLKKCTFTIATILNTIKTEIDANHNQRELSRNVAVAIGDFVICDPVGNIYVTKPDEFFKAYNMTACADVIPMERNIARVPTNLFQGSEYEVFQDSYGKEVRVYPGDGIIKSQNPQTGAPEFWRIDEEVLKQTYDFSTLVVEANMIVVKSSNPYEP